MPLVGIIGNPHILNEDYPAQATGVSNLEAVGLVAGAMPVMVPALPDVLPLDALIDRFDGFVFTGGRPNVHPEEYGEAETPAHGEFDRARDRLTLPLIRACVDRGVPILGICRGFQEFNVAFGGSLYPEIRDLPGRMNHRMPPDGTMEEKFELRHDVTFTEGGVFHALMGSTVVRTNTLHGQGIKEPGPRIVIDGYADDGTPEAIYVQGAAGFTLAVQWHPEWNAAADPVSYKLFSGFGEAVRGWAARSDAPALKAV